MRDPPSLFQKPEPAKQDKVPILFLSGYVRRGKEVFGRQKKTAPKSGHTFDIYLDLVENEVHWIERLAVTVDLIM
jgi:hypothetical protein